MVQSELLDSLDPTDRRARRSRADLRRLNLLMGHASIISHACRGRLRLGLRVPQIIELGAGDGTLLLSLARRWSRVCASARATLVDLQPVPSKETVTRFGEVNWKVNTVASDAYTFLQTPSLDADLILANLFLHHFSDDALRRLFRAAAARTTLFVACEPRRSQAGLRACRLLPCIGCNSVTRHDALVSVRAGFQTNELSALWPGDDRWELHEYSAGLFSHCFVARRNG